MAVDSVSSAILDWEVGRSGLAAATFLRAAESRRADTRAFAGTRARAIVWNLTLAASAKLSVGDTASARGLVDSIETIGRRSGNSRDPLLHHYVRGGLLSAAGRTDEAISQYRQAADSWVLGFTRINAELATALVTTGRPMQAIPVLEAALRGPIDGEGLYLTRTKLHLLLGDAFAATGQVDAAAAHYRLVERAWRDGDREVALERERARAWLAGHGRPLAN